MNYKSLISDDIVNSLMSYRKKITDKIAYLESMQDDVATILQLLDDSIEEQDLDKSVIEVFDKVIPAEGITLVDIDGNVRSFHSVKGPGVIWVFYDYVYNDSPASVPIVDISYDESNPTKVLSKVIKPDMSLVGSINDVFDMFVLNFGEGLSELQFTADIIRETVAGHLSSASDFEALFADKVSNPSLLFLDYYTQMKETVVAASSGGPMTILSAIASKFELTSRLQADKATGKIVQPSETTWKMSTINWGVVWNGILSVSEVLSQALLFIGKGWLKIIGTGIHVTATIISRLNSEINAGALPTVDEDAFLNSWFGNTSPTEVSSESVSFIGKADYPIKFSNGFCQCVLTLDATGKIQQRYYDCALLIPSTLDALINFCEYYLGYSLDGSGDVFQLVPSISRDEALGYLERLLTNSTVDQATFDAYDPALKAKSMLASTLLFSIGMDGEVLHTGMKFLWCNVASPSATKFRNIIESKLTLRVQDTDYSNVGSSFTPMIYGYSKLVASNITIDSFELIVALRNLLMESLTTEAAADTRLLLSRGSVSLKCNVLTYHMNTWVLRNDTPFGDGYRVGDFQTNSAAYAGSSIALAGVDGMIRYYPPQTSNKLATFVKVLAISIAVSVVVGAAVYGVKKLTNGRKQAKLYSDYNKANEIYKSDPSQENLKSLKRASKKLNNNVKLYGSSKYLSTLSGAKFGWGETPSTSLASTLLTPINNNGQDTLLENIYASITGVRN